MARPGPQPKDPERRQRRNATPEILRLPAAGYDGDYPALPAAYLMSIWDNDAQTPIDIRVEFLAATRDWYNAWACSPQATQFSGVTWLTLKRLAILVDRFERGETKHAGEIRLQESKLGATPEDMAKLRWVIDDDADAPGSKVTEPSARRGKAEPRHLAVVT
jgi:hypothetical protein